VDPVGTAAYLRNPLDDCVNLCIILPGSQIRPAAGPHRRGPKSGLLLRVERHHLGGLPARRGVDPARPGGAHDLRRHVRSFLVRMRLPKPCGRDVTCFSGLSFLVFSSLFPEPNDGEWIPLGRGGLTICDATSAAFWWGHPLWTL
jgi:hypothetical protein